VLHRTLDAFEAPRLSDVKKFEHDDEAYIVWLEEHPDGFVCNVRSRPDPNYVVLHRASCPTISKTNQLSGAFTGRAYRKWCGRSIKDLREAAVLEGRSNGSFSKRCGICRP
jgi:hypothetical protein